MDSSSRPATGTVFLENGNAERRGKELAGVPMAAMATPPQMRSPLLVSTALGLASEGKQRPRRPKQSDAVACSTSSSSSLFAVEIAPQINRQKKETEQFLLAQREQLRRAMAERLRVHCRAFSSVVGESAARRLRAIDAEVEQLERRRAELEDSIGRLRTESVAWQAKAMADQRMAATLNAQLQHVTAAAAATVAPSPGIADARSDTAAAEDAESAYVDPDRGNREPACRSCRQRRATVVVFPCRHLCICDACGAAARACPLCGGLATGIVRVFFS